MDLGYRMNRILQVNEETCYAELEPGVSFQMLHDELAARQQADGLRDLRPAAWRHHRQRAGPRGRLRPYFDHFGMLCGMEIVLGNGDVIRTGDGGLDTEDPINWHVSRFSSGPALDGLFAQSNFGIVTRVGIWLMPRPPVSRSFHFVFPDDEDIIELKLSNFVPSLFRVANDLYALAPEERNPEYMAGSKDGISDAGRAAQRKHGWAPGRCPACSMARPTPRWSRRSSAYGRISSAAARPATSAMRGAGHGALRVAIDSMDGRPSANELGMLQWRPGSGNSWFLPGTPMVGKQALALDRLGRAIFAKHGMDYIVMHVASARFARACMFWSGTRTTRTKTRGPMPAIGSWPKHSPGTASALAAPGGLPRLAHAADDPGTARRLRRHQEGA